MTPRIRIGAAAALAVALSLGAITSLTIAGMSVSTSGDREGPIRDCADVKIEFRDDDGGRLPTARASETASYAAPKSGPLRIRSTNHGGIQVTEHAGREMSVVLCKAAAAKSAVEAERMLPRISVAMNGDELIVNGPSGDGWYAYVLVEVPKGTAVDLGTENHELRIYGVSGDVNARTMNGPISIANTTGRVRAQARNGPISFRGGSGDVDLEAANGPISVWIEGSSWHGAGIEAGTKNGPLSLHVPDGYRSGVRVERASHVPFSAKKSFRGRVRTYEEDGVQVFELGEGTPKLLFSTRNGPLSIGDLGEDEDHDAQ
jgi:hypothetical protein